MTLLAVSHQVASIVTGEKVSLTDLPATLLAMSHPIQSKILFCHSAPAQCDVALLAMSQGNLLRLLFSRWQVPGCIRRVYIYLYRPL